MMNALNSGFGASSRLRIQYSKIQYCTVKPIYGFYGVRNVRTPGYCAILETAASAEDYGNVAAAPEDPRESGRRQSYPYLCRDARVENRPASLLLRRVHARTDARTPFRIPPITVR